MGLSNDFKNGGTYADEIAEVLQKMEQLNAQMIGQEVSLPPNIGTAHESLLPKRGGVYAKAAYPALVQWLERYSGVTTTMENYNAIVSLSPIGACSKYGVDATTFRVPTVGTGDETHPQGFYNEVYIYSGNIVSNLPEPEPDWLEQQVVNTNEIEKLNRPLGCVWMYDSGATGGKYDVIGIADGVFQSGATVITEGDTQGDFRITAGSNPQMVANIAGTYMIQWSAFYSGSDTRQVRFTFSHYDSDGDLVKSYFNLGRGYVPTATCVVYLNEGDVLQPYCDSYHKNGYYAYHRHNNLSFARIA